VADCPTGTYFDDNSQQCLACMLDCDSCTERNYCLDVIGPVNVILIADTGAVVNRDASWSYNPIGRIDSMSPAEGQVGTRVTISGISLRGSGSNVDTVTLGAHPATIISETDESVVVDVTSGSGADVTVTLTSSSGATVTLSAGWTYLTEGTINDVQPGSGAEGTAVAIAGSNLLGGGTSVRSITLAGTAVTGVTNVIGNEVITVEVAHASAGNGAVTIISNTGAVVTSADVWEYLERGTVDSLSPASGMQGTQVTIAGSRMLGGGASIASVTFGSIATSIVGDNDNDSEVVVQVLASGTANEQSNVVVVANTGAIITLVNGYTSIAAASIVQLVPALGQAGTEVDIQGTGLLGGGTSITSVTLAGVSVTSIDSSSETSIQVTAAAPSSDGAGDVVIVANTGATVTVSDGCTQL
jgi:hypothetical protein